jgi:hypothetical protein
MSELNNGILLRVQHRTPYKMGLATFTLFPEIFTAGSPSFGMREIVFPCGQANAEELSDKGGARYAYLFRGDFRLSFFDNFINHAVGVSATPGPTIAHKRIEEAQAHTRNVVKPRQLWIFGYLRDFLAFFQFVSHL